MAEPNESTSLILGGHCWALDKPRELIERMRIRMEGLRAAYTALSVEADYRYMLAQIVR